MSRTRLVIVLIVAVALVTLGALGGGWKWRHASATAPSEQLAGWTWDGSVAGADS